MGEGRFRRFGATALGWFTAMSLAVAATILVTAGGSGAAPGVKGNCVSGDARHAPGFMRGNSCADMGITLTHGPIGWVEIGIRFKAKIAVHNYGPTNAFGATASDTLPASMTFVGATSGQGSCTGPPVGQTGTVNCMIGTMTPGQTVNIVVRMRPTRSGMQTNQASTSSSSFDPGPNANTDSDAIDVQVNTRGCTMIGTNADETIDGTGEDDVICGLQGADTIDGKDGADTVFGERGPDTITDHSGTDELHGGPGDDSLDSADGTAGDMLQGDLGTNTCTSDAGDTEKNC